ncbi:MAG: hypothetical protein K2X27_18390 [Candidatus Obscuribacterales bacterium]|nr:hypothetical protein [Candidatus Obscuribacterales bacterium]
MTKKEIESDSLEKSSAERLAEIAKADASTLLSREFNAGSKENQGFLKILNELEEKNKAMTASLLHGLQIDMPKLPALSEPKLEPSGQDAEQKSVFPDYTERYPEGFKPADLETTFCSSTGQWGQEKLSAQTESEAAYDSKARLKSEAAKNFAELNGDPYKFETARSEAMFESKMDLSAKTVAKALGDLLEGDKTNKANGGAQKGKLARFDKSGDGVIDKDELELAIKESKGLEKAALIYLRNVLRGPLQEEITQVNPDGSRSTRYVYENENYQLAKEQISEIRDSTIKAENFFQAKESLKLHYRESLKEGN